MLPKTGSDGVSQRGLERRIRPTKRAVDGDALFTVRSSSSRPGVRALVRTRLGHDG